MGRASRCKEQGARMTCVLLHCPMVHDLSLPRHSPLKKSSISPRRNVITAAVFTAPHLPGKTQPHLCPLNAGPGCVYFGGQWWRMLWVNSSTGRWTTSGCHLEKWCFPVMSGWWGAACKGGFIPCRNQHTGFCHRSSMPPQVSYGCPSITQPYLASTVVISNDFASGVLGHISLRLLYPVCSAYLGLGSVWEKGGESGVLRSERLWISHASKNCTVGYMQDI